MIEALALWLLPHVGAKLAKPVAWLIVIVAAVLLFIAVKAAYDSSVVQDALEGANAEQLERKDEATGREDLESNERREAHEQRVKTTGELVDEAIERGCAVGEYLASDGARCM